MPNFLRTFPASVGRRCMSTALRPPFTQETATAKVRLAQDLWNSKIPERVAKAYTPDSVWRNRTSFIKGRAAIKDFLQQKWEKEHGYQLRKELFIFNENKIAVQFWYEWNESPILDGQWYRSHGLEHWTFDADGLMKERRASINDMPIAEKERWFKDGKLERGTDPVP